MVKIFPRLLLQISPTMVHLTIWSAALLSSSGRYRPKISLKLIFAIWSFSKVSHLRENQAELWSAAVILNPTAILVSEIFCCLIEFFYKHTTLAIMAILSSEAVLRENKMLPQWILNPGPLIPSPTLSFLVNRTSCERIFSKKLLQCLDICKGSPIAGWNLNLIKFYTDTCVHKIPTNLMLCFLPPEVFMTV